MLKRLKWLRQWLFAAESTGVVVDWVGSSGTLALMVDTGIVGVVVGGILVEGSAVVVASFLVDKGDTLAWELMDGVDTPIAAFVDPLAGLFVGPGVFGWVGAAFGPMFGSCVAALGLLAFGFAMEFPLFVVAPYSFLI